MWEFKPTMNALESVNLYDARFRIVKNDESVTIRCRCTPESHFYSLKWMTTL